MALFFELPITNVFTFPFCYASKCYLIITSHELQYPLHGRTGSDARMTAEACSLVCQWLSLGTHWSACKPVLCRHSTRQSLLLSTPSIVSLSLFLWFCWTHDLVHFPSSSFSIHLHVFYLCYTYSFANQYAAWHHSLEIESVCKKSIKSISLVSITSLKLFMNPVTTSKCYQLVQSHTQLISWPHVDCKLLSHGCGPQPINTIIRWYSRL
jgi:hypothetical protein